MYRCPKCNSTDLKVAAHVWVVLHQHGDEVETEYQDGDHEWGNNSTMQCSVCSHAGSGAAFVYPNKRKKGL